MRGVDCGGQYMCATIGLATGTANPRKRPVLMKTLIFNLYRSKVEIRSHKIRRTSASATMVACTVYSARPPMPIYRSAHPAASRRSSMAYPSPRVFAALLGYVHSLFKQFIQWSYHFRVPFDPPAIESCGYKNFDACQTHDIVQPYTRAQNICVYISVPGVLAQIQVTHQRGRPDVSPRATELSQVAKRWRRTCLQGRG
eukprot:SAG22_NODE_112_length_19423_cov_11.462223_1_plen_198_part_10